MLKNRLLTIATLKMLMKKQRIDLSFAISGRDRSERAADQIINAALR